MAWRSRQRFTRRQGSVIAVTAGPHEPLSKTRYGVREPARKFCGHFAEIAPSLWGTGRCGVELYPEGARTARGWNIIAIREAVGA